MSEDNRCFRLRTLGNTADKELAFIDEPPDGLGIYDYCLSEGEPIGDHYPQNARIYLQGKHPGIRLPSLIGNTLCLLIVNSAFKETLLQHAGTAIEALPFTLYNHKKRVHSRDYWIVNPLGIIDCLDKQRSEIKYLDEDPAQVVAVNKFVVDGRKLKDQPEIFRVPEARTEYFITLSLAKRLKQAGFTNIFVDAVEVSNISS